MFLRLEICRVMICDSCLGPVLTGHANRLLGSGSCVGIISIFGLIPVRQDVLVPARPLDVTEVLHVWNTTSRTPHHLQGVGVQHSCFVKPKESLHVFHFGGEGEPAPPHAAQGIRLQVVVLMEVVLSDTT